MKDTVVLQTLTIAVLIPFGGFYISLLIDAVLHQGVPSKVILIVTGFYLDVIITILVASLCLLLLMGLYVLVIWLASTLLSASYYHRRAMHVWGYPT